MYNVFQVVFGKYEVGKMFGPEEEHRLSAISIRSLSLVSIFKFFLNKIIQDMEFSRDPKDHQKVVDFITHLRPVCKTLHVSRFSFDLFVPLTDSIICEDDIDLDRAIRGFGSYDRETILSTLTKVFFKEILS